MRIRHALPLAVLALAAAGAQAGTVTFSSFSNTLPAVPALGQPQIAARGADTGQAMGRAWSWNYSGNAADPARPVWAAGSNLLCIGAGANCASNDNDGAAGADYAGYEFLYFRFTLPADATHVSLHFAALEADDRVALMLNGQRLGGVKSTLSAPVSINNMRDASGLHTVDFVPTAPVIDDPGLFSAGAENVLGFWINNTFSGVFGDARPHQFSGDPSALYTAGWISYDSGGGVPAPATLALVLAGLAQLGRQRRAGRG